MGWEYLLDKLKNKLKNRSISGHEDLIKKALKKGADALIKKMGFEEESVKEKLRQALQLRSLENTRV